MERGSRGLNGFTQIGLLCVALCFFVSLCVTAEKSRLLEPVAVLEQLMTTIPVTVLV